MNSSDSIKFEKYQELNPVTCLLDLEDALTPSYLGLKSLAALISSSDCIENMKALSGIESLIEMCLKQQVREFEKFKDNFSKTEYYRFHHANNLFKYIKEFPEEPTNEHLETSRNTDKIISILDEIIAQNGYFSSPASELKSKCELLAGAKQ